MLQIEDIQSGTEIKCIIDEEICDDAKIQIENGEVYICQNIADGDRCNDTLGYRYSWRVSHKDNITKDMDEFFRSQDVENVTLLEVREWDSEVNHAKHSLL